MAVLTVQTVSISGLEPAALAAAAEAGDSFRNTGHELLEINNAGVAPITLTIVAQRACSFGDTHDQTVTVTNGERRLVGPFRTDQFNDENGRVQLTYSAHEDVTVGVYRLAS